MSTEESIIQNLKDAGCNKNQIKEFMDYAEMYEKNSLLKLLRLQRGNLLAGLHEKQRMIECLDYLVYQIEKDNIRFEEESVILLKRRQKFKWKIRQIFNVQGGDFK